MAVQVWSVAADGGNMYSDNLSEYLRFVLLSTVKFRQFCDAEDHSKFGMKKGDTFHWDIYSKLATKGKALQEDLAMPSSKYTITQGSGTIKPYGNSVEYTGLLDDLSYHDVKTVIDKVLRVDATEALDDAAYAQFALTPLVASVVSATTSFTLDTGGTASNQNNVALGKGHIKYAAIQMQERNIPGYFPNGDYGMLARPATYEQVYTDLEAVHLYVNPGFDMIMNGETGRYMGVRCFTHTGQANKGWAQAKSDEAFWFGGDTVHEAIVVPEEIRGKIPINYGLDKGLAWYYLGGFALVHTVAAQARIIKWSSSS